MQISISNIVKGTVIGSAFTAISRYFTRVTQAGAIYEKPLCVESGINSSPLLQQASMLILPSGYKGGTAYAELPSNGNGDLTWTRGSDAWRTNSDGLIQRVPWNLLQQSETFDNAIWNKEGSTITANTTNAPNGTLTADTITENSAASTQHRLLQGNSLITNGSTYTLSCYVKQGVGTRDFALIATSAGIRVYYNLSTGAVGTQSLGTGTITNVGDGWYRVTATGTSNATSVSCYLAMTNGATLNSETYSGNGTSSLILWGAQLVEGTTAQTYLPTTDRLNFPRLSYMYGSCPSVLLEPQRTNLLVRSNEFSNVGVWVNTNLTVSDNSQLGIDGNTTAALITTTSTLNLLNQQVSVTAGTVYTFSFYVKRGTMTDMKYRVRNVTGASDIIPPTSYYSQTNASTFARISVTITAPAGCTAITFYPFSDTGSIGTAILTQAQVEIGAYATTIIPTTSAQATRVADSFSRNNIYTNGLISASGGTWFVELRNNIVYTRDAGNTGIYIADDSSATNSFRFRNFGGGARTSIVKSIATVESTLFITTTDTVKFAIKWNGSTADVFVNGTKQVSGTIFTTTAMEFLLGNANDCPKFIQQMALFPSALTDTQCQTLTTL